VSPIGNGSYVNSIVEDLNLETKLTFLNFFFVGGSIDTIVHSDGNNIDFYPTYEEYTIDAGVTILKDTLWPIELKWLHECIHPMACYFQSGEYDYYNSWPWCGRYEGGYDLAVVKEGSDSYNFSFGVFIDRGFLDYEGVNIVNWNVSNFLIYLGASQKLTYSIFYLVLDEKVYNAGGSNLSSFYTTLQAELGMDCGDGMVLGVKVNNTDPLSPLLWAEGIQFQSNFSVALFFTFTLGKA
jgi:hypothetical protein